MEACRNGSALKNGKPYTIATPQMLYWAARHLDAMIGFMALKVFLPSAKHLPFYLKGLTMLQHYDKN